MWPTAGPDVGHIKTQTTDKTQKNRPKPVSVGAVEKTRTSTGCPTATSTLRVYQFRHDRIVVDPNCSSGGACSKRIWGAQGRDAEKLAVVKTISRACGQSREFRL